MIFTKENFKIKLPASILNPETLIMIMSVEYSPKKSLDLSLRRFRPYKSETGQNMSFLIFTSRVDKAKKFKKCSVRLYLSKILTFNSLLNFDFLLS